MEESSTPLYALAGFNVAEVVVEAVYFGEFVQMPIERSSHTLNDLRVGKVAALVGDAERGQPEAGCGDAGHAARIAAAVEIVARAIENLAGFVACLLPEEETALALEIVEKSFIAAFRLPGTGGEELRGQKRTSAGGGEGLQDLATGDGKGRRSLNQDRPPILVRRICGEAVSRA